MLSNPIPLRVVLPGFDRSDRAACGVTRSTRIFGNGGICTTKDGICPAIFKEVPLEIVMDFRVKHYESYCIPLEVGNHVGRSEI